MKLNCIKETDLELFHKGEDFQSFKHFGAYVAEENGTKGTRFTVWAPNAKELRVVGDFNNWNGSNSIMEKIKDSGAWSVFIPNLGEGELYKYEIISKTEKTFLKADPYAVYSECRPANASIVYSLDGYEWEDREYIDEMKSISVYSKPVNIYEVHAGSWRRKSNGEFLSYRELADELIGYASEMGYTHIELMPLAEHPFDGSWGYQVTGYYSITSRYGEPKDFMYFVDKCHQAGIGVIVDWVPGHFCRDEHGLAEFDGEAVYEYENILKSQNIGWGTLNFDLGNPEVRSFMISNAFFYFDVYHVDGLRVDAVAAMLYLDYGRENGQWVPNKFGGRENLDAVGFMKKLNEIIFRYFPQALMIAEESTAWPMVTKPAYIGGLGYNYKWNMGWMNDMLRYFEMDSVHRKWHHNLVTFSFMYTFSENFILPLSHDEVVHGKKSLLNKMPGDYWEKFAGLRAFYGFMMAHPGKKLLFMGGEFGQFIEWKYDNELDWMLFEYDMHKKMNNYVKCLNKYYKEDISLWERDHEGSGFEWIDPNDYTHSIVTFMRKGKDEENYTVILCNFTPVEHEGYRIGVPEEGYYIEAFNSDDEAFGGSGKRNSEVLISENIPWHNQKYSIEISVPSLSALYFKHKLVKE